MELFVVCYVGGDGTNKWLTVVAESARQAVEWVKGVYPGYKVVNCFKQIPDWKWR